ncbi:hypothetical protein LK10_04325 [Sinomonas humi]|uniref:Uncharacterized protein n=1 Tax=Sinomonas humi TaxID=1338436 RepID=A0A0B2ARU3_9MICC|nr:hypothetical protein LK10_04325 [Sinomonas humi]
MSAAPEIPASAWKLPVLECRAGSACPTAFRSRTRRASRPRRTRRSSSPRSAGLRSTALRSLPGGRRCCRPTVGICCMRSLSVFRARC